MGLRHFVSMWPLIFCTFSIAGSIEHHDLVQLVISIPAFLLSVALFVYLNKEKKRKPIQQKKNNLPKAVASYKTTKIEQVQEKRKIEFPYNPLRILGMDRLKKYVPPEVPSRAPEVQVNWEGLARMLGWKGSIDDLKNLKLF